MRQHPLVVDTVSPVFRATPTRRVRVGVGAALVIATWAPLIERAQSGNKTLSGISASGVRVSGLAPNPLREALTPLANDIATRPITVQFGDVETTVTPSSLNVQMDMDATVLKLQEAGFDTNPLAATVGVISRQLEDDHVSPVVGYSEDALLRLLDSWERDPNVTLTEGDLTFNGTKVTVVRPIAGRGFDRARAQELLIAAIRDPRQRMLAIPLEQREPNLSLTAIEDAASRARTLLGKSYDIEVGSKRFRIGPEQLAPALRTVTRTRTMDLRVDPLVLRAQLKDRLASIEQEPVDAKWKFEGSKPIVVPSRNGRSVPLQKIATEILDGSTSITTSFEVVKPERDTKWARRMDIKEVVGTFTTPFPPGEDRIINIQVAAKQLNNTVVEPGTVFSLNELLGERTTEKGYVVAHSIAADLTFEDTVGGGVSQVSTTLYNATYAAGLEDVEHTAHSIYISRYPMGREATLTWPSIDNKFRNTLRSGVLIRTKVEDESITVTLYGNAHGQRVLVNEPIQLREIDVTTNATCKVNRQMSSGARRFINGTPGYEVEYSREIIQANGTSKTERRNARYQMRPNRCEVGPDTPTANPQVGTSSSSAAAT